MSELSDKVKIVLKETQEERDVRLLQNSYINLLNEKRKLENGLDALFRHKKMIEEDPEKYLKVLKGEEEFEKE